MGHCVEIGDSIIVTIGGKALSGKATDTRDNSAGKPVILSTVKAVNWN